MTILLPTTRALSRTLLFNSNKTLTRLATNSLARVEFLPKSPIRCANAHQGLLSAIVSLPHLREYATGTAARPAGRPKAHTGRPPAQRKTGSRAKKAGQAKKKAAPKKKKAAAAKPKRKRVVSKTAQARKARTSPGPLRKTALLNGAPKRLPETAWMMMVAENPPQRGAGLDTGRLRRLSQQYKNISPEEMERLNHAANSNKTKNVVAYKKWVGTHTPAEIKQANHARSVLKRQSKQKGGKKVYVHIKDERLVKQPVNAYLFFIKDRHASGDFHRMELKEASRLAAREWKDLSAAQKKPYQDQFKLDKERYLDEYKTVYGEEPKSRRAVA